MNSDDGFLREKFKKFLKGEFGKSGYCLYKPIKQGEFWKINDPCYHYYDFSVKNDNRGFKLIISKFLGIQSKVVTIYASNIQFYRQAEF